MTEISVGGDPPYTLELAADALYEQGLIGFLETLQTMPFSSDAERLEHLQSLYEQSWRVINNAIEATSSAETDPAQRIVHTFTTVLRLNEEVGTANITLFAFWLKDRTVDAPYESGSPVLGEGYIPIQQQLFQDRLLDICLEANLTGQTTTDHHLLAEQVTNLMYTSMTARSMFRDEPDKFPTDYLAQRLIVRAFQAS